LYSDTNISVEIAGYVLFDYTEEGERKVPRKDGTYTPSYTASCPTKLEYS
jgi:hypothetical protein